MAEIRHLRAAPIVEAVFDFRVRPASDLDINVFASIKETLFERFPKIEERRGGQVVIGFQPGEPAVVSSQDLVLQGVFYKSEDEKLIAQFRPDGFTLNRLAPYTRWDELYPIAANLWKQYCDLAKPQAVSRLGLRYINHIVLPWATVDLDEFLTAGPKIPAELPQSVPSFNLQVMIVDAERGLGANIVQKLESLAEQQTLTVMLDIDAYKPVDKTPDDPTIQACFEQLRELKNLIFFSHLTEKAIGRFV